MISRTAKTEEGNRMDSAATTLDDDMVTEILLRLPPKSIFRYKSVSKEWNSLLTSPEFLSHYSRRFNHRQRTLGSPPNLLGFFLLPEFTLGAPRMSFFSIRGPRIGRENFSSDLGYFITSSNGLVLCRGHTDPRPYHILNPMTRKHVSLPPPRRKYHLHMSAGLWCDEDSDDLTPRYEVVVIVYDPCDSDLDNNKLSIETYSSETKEWRESVLVGTSNFRQLRYYSPTVLKGVFYWWVETDCLAVYDPHNKQGGNKDPNHLQLIQLPADPAYHPAKRHVLNQTPDGRLIFGITSNGLIKIWELSRGELGFWRETTITEQEWVLVYQVPCEIGLQSMALISCNPLILLVRQGSSVFQYNMETKVMTRIVSLTEKQRPKQPFFEATSFSSYLLS